MAGFGGSDEIVVREIHSFGQVAEALGHLIRECLWRDARVSGRFLYFLTMLVGAGQEIGVLPEQFSVTSENISGNGCVGMTYVRMAIDVIDWGCDVENSALFSAKVASSITSNCQPVNRLASLTF